MSLYYTKTTLQDIEVKIHDARRKIEEMISLAKLGVIPGDKEIVDLNHDLIDAVNQLTDYYINHINDFEDLENNIEEIVLETPETNVIPFPNKEDK